MVSGSVCLSDLISFDNWWQQWESRASHCLTCAESGDGSSVTGMWFILLRSHQLLRGDGDTLFMFWHLCSRNVSVTFLLKVWRRLCSALFEKYIVLKLCWKKTIPATLNNPLPKPRITWELLPANGKNLRNCMPAISMQEEVAGQLWWQSYWILSTRKQKCHCVQLLDFLIPFQTSIDKSSVLCSMQCPSFQVFGNFPELFVWQVLLLDLCFLCKGFNLF